MRKLGPSFPSDRHGDGFPVVLANRSSIQSFPRLTLFSIDEGRRCRAVSPWRLNVHWMYQA